MTTTTGNEEYGYEVLVKNKLLKVQHDLSSGFSVQTLTVPVKRHWHIIGPKRSTLNTIIYNDSSNGGGSGAYSPVSVKLGLSKSLGASDRSSNTQQILDNSIIAKRPVKEVERIVEGINEKVEDAKQFTIPEINTSHIINLEIFKTLQVLTFRKHNSDKN
nr:8823_t:CDS:2 [Entrophospora candida]